MQTADMIDPHLGPPRTTPPLRLAVGRVFSGAFVGSFLVVEIALILAIFGRLRRLPPLWKTVVLLRISVAGLLWCALISGAVAIAGVLLVRLLLRPWMARWFDPRPADASVGGHAPFRLGSSEWVEAEFPGRLRRGGRGEPGHLVLTNQGVWFFPSAWDSEPWNSPLGRLDHLRIEPSRYSALKSVRGWPDEVVFRDEDGYDARVALADPRAVLDWFENSDVPRYLHLNTP